MELSQIRSIGLNSSSYGEHLNDRLETIDKNFKTIVGTDFLKGDQGDSINVEEFIMDPNDDNKFGLYLNEEDLSPKSLYELVRNAILDEIDEDDGKRFLSPVIVDGEEINWDDQLIKANKVTIVYRLDKSINRKVIISSLYYTFYDNRFNNLQFVKNYDIYNGLLDMSCIVCIQNFSNDLGEYRLSFKKLNSFPTIYYNADVKDTNNEYQGTFCWIIGGNKTEIPAVGPRGAVGKHGSSYLVKVNSRQGSTKCFVTHVFVIDESIDDNGVVKGGKFIPLVEFLNQDPGTEENPLKVYDLPFDENTFLFAIKENQNAEDFGNKVWISPLVIEKSMSGITNYYALCDDSNSIMGMYESNELQKWLSSLYNSANIKGLFLPITAGGDMDGKELQSAHMIYASGENVKNKLIFEPVLNALDPKSTELYDDASMYINYDTSVKKLNIENPNSSLEIKNGGKLNVTDSGLAEFNNNVIFNIDNQKISEFGMPDVEELKKSYDGEDGGKKWEDIEKSEQDRLIDEFLSYKIDFDSNVKFEKNIKVSEKIETRELESESLNVKNDINTGVLNSDIIASNNIDIENDLTANNIVVNNVTATNLTSKGDVSLGNNSIIIDDEDGIIKLNNIVNVGSDSSIKLFGDEKLGLEDDIIENIKYESIGGISPITAESNKNLSNSFYDLLSNPLKQTELSGYVDNNDGKYNSITYSTNQSISIRDVNEEVKAQNIKLEINRDFGILFTASGRNLYSTPLLASNSWSKPRWISTDILITLNDGISKPIELFKGTYNKTLELFTQSNKDVFDIGKSGNKSANAKDIGDTTVCLFTISPMRKEYTVDKEATNLELSIDITINFDRTLTNAEDWKKPKTWRGAKILGILSTKKSSPGTCNAEIIGRINNGSVDGKPIESKNITKEEFNKIIYPGSVKDIRYYIGDTENLNLSRICTVKYNKIDDENSNDIIEIYKNGIRFSNKSSNWFSITSYENPDATNKVNGYMLSVTKISKYKDDQGNDITGPVTETIDLFDLVSAVKKLK